MEVKLCQMSILEGIKSRDAKSILVFLAFLRTSGALGEVLAAWYADLGWWDITWATAKFLAFCLLAIASAGSVALVKVASALLNAMEIKAKFDMLGKIQV